MTPEETTLIHVTANNENVLSFSLDINAILELEDIDAIYAINSRLSNFQYKLNQIIDEIISNNNNEHDCENCPDKDTCESRDECQNNEDEDQTPDTPTNIT